MAWAIGYAFAEIHQPGHTVIGHDIRESSLALSRALARGLHEGGSKVSDIGLCGTEEVYHATKAAKEQNLSWAVR